MDGLEVGRVLAKQPEHPYLIAYSAYSREMDRKRTKEAGFDLHLEKAASASTDQMHSALSRLAKSPAVEPRPQGD
jgi:CheY-like chemotaxis protein